MKTGEDLAIESFWKIWKIGASGERCEEETQMRGCMKILPRARGADSDRWGEKSGSAGRRRDEARCSNHQSESLELNSESSESGERAPFRADPADLT